MMYFKQFAVAALAIAAAASASATSQPFTATSGSVTLDTTYLSANGYTVGALGSATYNASTGVLSGDPLSAVTTSANPGPLTASFDATSGLSLTKGTTTVKLTNFSFDAATNSLFGNISVGFLLNLTNQSLLTATTVAGDFGGSSLSSVATSSTARTLNLAASSFVLSDAFSTLLSSNGITPSTVSFVASIVKNVNVGKVSTPTVPEPSTYALMGLGLVGIALAGRRKA